jgi:uncharacterized protein YfeS
VTHLSRDESHPKAKEALVDAFFWDVNDPCGPFGNDTGQEVLEAFRDLRASSPKGDPLELLGELLESWEVADTGWDVVDEDLVQAIGAEDELGLLVRDEAILALAFASIVIDGRTPLEVRRRAVLALTRQALPALLHGWGDHMAVRRRYVDRMRDVLSLRWDEQAS